MNTKFSIPVLLFLTLMLPVKAQLKFIIEDFEGFTNSASDFKANGLFTFGNAKAHLELSSYNQHTSPNYIGERYITVKNETTSNFSGWGKGICLNVELDASKDYINFYINQPLEDGIKSITVQLQEDDNDNNIYEKEKDDTWIYTEEIKNSSLKTNWQLISIPLRKFIHFNNGGDNVFNCNYKNGKLLCLIMSFITPEKQTFNQTLSFDFICFSQGPLIPDFTDKETPPNYCSLGLWSKEGNKANFTEIGTAFKELFEKDSEKKIGVVHFFQPFAVDGINTQNLYPSVGRINRIISDGYIPMITLENHFITKDLSIKQPNLYSILEGHFDSFLGSWANQIKEVEGIVLLRILHEFNGDWYPWCIINNDKDSQLFKAAYRHIHKIFKDNNVTNVRFIWCPNSMSVPQEKWNYIMDAYPGDEYVDFVGLDIYNGAGQTSAVWASFRKVAIENYFILTQQLPNKPFFICETASRERGSTEPKLSQTKAEWIRQQSEAIKYDMPRVQLLNWFNEKGTFKINSSIESRNAFLKHFLKDDYFKSGTEYLLPLIIE